MKLRIVHDDDSGFHPRRDCSTFGVMACWHRRYKLGDVQPREAPSEWLEENAPEGSIVLPLYLYDHSGITMSTSPFSCPWDSGQVGVIVATQDKIREEYGEVTTETLDKVRGLLRAEVNGYDQYLRGAIWGFVVEGCDPLEVIESCWGFVGDTLEETGIAESLPDGVKEQLEEAWNARA